MDNVSWGAVAIVTLLRGAIYTGLGFLVSVLFPAISLPIIIGSGIGLLLYGTASAIHKGVNEIEPVTIFGEIERSIVHGILDFYEDNLEDVIYTVFHPIKAIKYHREAKAEAKERAEAYEQATIAKASNSLQEQLKVDEPKPEIELLTEKLVEPSNENEKDVVLEKTKTK